jgi:hypothetical protein
MSFSKGDGRNLARRTDCSSCNGYGWIYFRYSGRYDEQGRYIYDWTPCEECNKEGKQ